ncbi:MAG: ABC transporter ATP-binding protein [Bacteroidota bacterium]
MSKDLTFLANEIRAILNADPQQGAAALVDFAMEHASNNKRIHQALLCKMKLTAETASSVRAELVEELHQLLEKIESEVQVSATPEKMALAIPQQPFDPDQVVCKASNLWKTFRKNQFTIQDVSLDLRLGEITGVVGENGNGKTTLFRMLIGELDIDSGELSYPFLASYLQEPALTWDLIKHHIAFIPQDLPKWFGSVKDNLHYELAIHGIKGEQNDEEVEYIIHRLGLESHQDKSWAQLSGGYKLRFALAKALVWKPVMLVIDEPLANLDIKAQLVILNDLRDLANSYRHPLTILISSQHLHEIENVSDRILFLREGAPEYYGKVEDLGNERQENTFEFSSPISQEDLEKRLAGLHYYQLEHTGLAFVIRTPLNVDQKVLMQHFLDADVEIEYFRNISKSTKQLFV